MEKSTSTTPTYSTSTAERDTESIGLYYQHLAVSRGLTTRLNHAWSVRDNVDITQLLNVGQCLSQLLMPTYPLVGVYETDTGALLKATYSKSLADFNLSIAAHSHEEAHRLLKLVRTLLPDRPRVSEKEEVRVAFWCMGPNGASVISRTISITPWNRVQPNYPAGAGSELNKLMGDFRPTKAGQLILWYGPPGTGKTHALRALAYEWRKWCSFHYITDPEVFFGASAKYMMDVLLLRDDNGEADSEDSNRWRLLILEDSGELMVPDAKAQAGQGLSRLLNVVDGLIGQGLKIMVLVTTNEALKKLHPAVSRPGRCAAKIEFGEFTKKEALVWLAKYADTKKSQSLPTAMSLADLFALSDYGQIVHEEKTPPSVGFVA